MFNVLAGDNKDKLGYKSPGVQVDGKNDGTIIDKVVDWVSGRDEGSEAAVKDAASHKMPDSNPDTGIEVKLGEQKSGIHIRGDNHGTVFNAGTKPSKK